MRNLGFKRKKDIVKESYKFFDKSPKKKSYQGKSIFTIFFPLIKLFYGIKEEQKKI